MCSASGSGEDVDFRGFGRRVAGGLRCGGGLGAQVRLVMALCVRTKSNWCLGSFVECGKCSWADLVDLI